MSKNFVRWTQEGNIAVVVIDNPPVNALHSGVGAALRACLGEIRGKEDCRALVLTGEGKVFAAGADIKELAALTGSAASTLPLTKGMHEIFDYLENFLCLPLRPLTVWRWGEVWSWL